MNTYTEKETQEYLQLELKKYKKERGGITAGELKELNEWVKSGNSVYCNPWAIAWDNGCTMDYISCIRIVEDMRDERPEHRVHHINGGN